MVFKREFLKGQKALWIWTIIIGGLTFLVLSIYPELSKQMENVEAMLEAYPDSIMKALGVDQLTFSTVIEFYAIEGYMMVTLFGSIYAVIVASNMLAKEEAEHTVEFLMSKPITRSSVVTQKLLAVALNLFIFNAVITLLNYFGFQLSDDADQSMTAFWLLSIAPLFLHYTFAAIAYLISSMLRKTRNIMSISIGIVFLTYFLDLVQGMSEKVEALKYFTPFHYVNGADIVINKELHVGYIFTMIVVILVSITATYWIYHRKDLAS